ncbi:MAG: hypothetical protein ACKO6N_27135 [Myxococcota bacterium]
MDRHQATLKLFKELKRGGDPYQKLAQFQTLHELLMSFPLGTDMYVAVDVITKVKNWAPALTLEEATERVVAAARHGIDPLLLEETLRFIATSQGGFVRTELTELIFRYTLTQIRAAKHLWDNLSAPDKASITVDMLLEIGLDEHPEVVALVQQELATLSGLSLQVAGLLKDAVAPSVVLELWKFLRNAGPVKAEELELLDHCIDVVGRRSALSQGGQHGLLDERETSTQFFRAH